LRNGQGIEYRQDRTILLAGQWSKGVFTQTLALDRDRFPFDGLSQASASPHEAGRRDLSSGGVTRDEEKVFQAGDGSPQDSLCKRYGFRPQTDSYAECRMRIDFAEAESRRQQEQFEREQAEYERRVAAIERERERQRSARLFELSARLLSGQSIPDAFATLGTGAPMAPRRPSPIMQTIILPGGGRINCTTMGAMTNCF
jgi:hypothetical protein